MRWTGQPAEAENRIADPVAAALAVLARRPGRAVPGRVYLSGEMGLIVGPALATVLVIARPGVRARPAPLAFTLIETAHGKRGGGIPPTGPVAVHSTSLAAAHTADGIVSGDAVPWPPASA
jgi:hypothetical protein